MLQVTQFRSLSAKDQGIYVEHVQHKLKLYSEKYGTLDETDHVEKSTAKTTSVTSGQLHLGKRIIKPVVLLRQRVAERIDAIPVEEACTGLDKLLDWPERRVINQKRLKNPFAQHYLINQTKGEKEVFFFELMSWIFIIMLYRRTRYRKWDIQSGKVLMDGVVPVTIFLSRMESVSFRSLMSWGNQTGNIRKTEKSRTGSYNRKTKIIGRIDHLLRKVIAGPVQMINLLINPPIQISSSPGTKRFSSLRENSP